MGLKKLIKSLQKTISSESSKKHTSSDRITELLGDLEKKEKKLKRKLAKAENPKKRKDLKLQLKIISTQRNKGMARLQELEKK
jgi:FixJ family two-component response regulator